MKQSACRRCGEAIFWAKTRNGKNMMMDYEPSSDGRYVIAEQEGRDPDVSKLGYDEAKTHTGDKYTCHYDTCVERKDGQN